MNGRVEIGEDIAALLATSVNHRGEVRGELVAAFALRTAAAATPTDEAAKLALGVVVGRFDVGVVDEAPEGVAVFEDIATRALKALGGLCGA